VKTKTNITEYRMEIMGAPRGASKAQDQFRIAYEFCKLEHDYDIDWIIPFDFDENRMQDSILCAVIENEVSELHCRSGYQLTSWDYNVEQECSPLHIAFNITFCPSHQGGKGAEVFGYVTIVNVPIMALELELAVSCCADEVIFNQISDSLMAIKKEAPELGGYYDRACSMLNAKREAVPLYDPTKSLIGQRFVTIESLRAAVGEQFGLKQ
jgi:hypothetical protein